MMGEKELPGVVRAPRRSNELCGGPTAKPEESKAKW